MRIAIHEAVCGGGWPGTIPDSLGREGAAMLMAVATDFAQLPGYRVVTTWDARLPLWHDQLGRIGLPQSSAAVSVQTVPPLCDPDAVLDDLADACEALLLIAPEFDDLLATRCERLQTRPVLLLNSAPDAIRLCTDKLLLHDLCLACHVPTIPTQLATTRTDWEPLVIKLRDGAGSLEMRQFATQASFQEFQQGRDLSRFVVQPYLAGQPLSVATLFDHGRLVSIWPATRQRLSTDGRFTYQGGEILDNARLQSTVESFLREVFPRLQGSACAGLHGYTGIDLIFDEQSESLLLVEINPRLTTSYLGYRAVCDENLAGWLLQPGRLPAPGFSGTVDFHSDGRIGTMQR